MKKFNADELKKYKKALLNLRMLLTDELQKIKDGTLNQTTRDLSGDLSGYSLHMADQATDNYDREFLLGLAANEQEVLYQIDESLKRIEDKSYGTCLMCSKTISKARLNARPFAEWCIQCQEAREKGQNQG